MALITYDKNEKDVMKYNKMVDRMLHQVVVGQVQVSPRA